MKIARVFFALPLAFLLLGTALLGLRAEQGSAEPKTEPRDKTTIQYYSLLAETMQPVDSSIGYDNTQALLKTTADSATGMTSYIGQLSLPHGAKIVQVGCDGIDTDAKGEFYFRLYRYSLSHNPVWEGVTNFSHSGIGFAGGKMELWAAILNANLAVVNNSKYSYGIFLVLPKAVSGRLEVLRFMVKTVS
jgi:hypothetical protein